MEIINLGITMKIGIPSDEYDDIFSKINEMITVESDNCIFTGILKKVNSKTIKSNDGEKNIFKELVIEIESIENNENFYFSFPDKKDEFLTGSKVK